MEVRVRAARAADVAAVLALERGAVEAPHWSEAVYRQLVEGEGDGVRRRLLVATLDGDDEVIGFAAGQVVQIGEDEVVGEIESLVVRADARRGGVGRALCGALMRWFGEAGAGRVELEVRASSAGAMALYRKMGFREVGRRRGYYVEPVEDAVLMRAEGMLGCRAGHCDKKL